ncbi:MAG: CDP-diacylglycerol--serine O-phosphatidyltransferase [Motiliproteus sp.]|jgi:CDP-diacylglycerol--serine O-phosphatidyltransferase
MTEPDQDQQSEGVSEADTASSPNTKTRSRGIYLLPNLLTSAALFSGFYAIIAGMNGDFEKAAIAIFVSMVLDGLDGRVARMTNTQSEFGAQYDSLADMVSFGVAPALVLFTWSLHDAGKVGWAAAFVFVAGAALRLARFNTQIGSTDKRYFVGLPSPAAAGVVAGMVWVGAQFDVDAAHYALAVAPIVALSGILMVSNFYYHSFKEIDFKGKVPFVVLLGVVMLFAVIATDPATLLWLIFVVYAFSGPLQAVVRYKKKRLSE